MIYKGLYTGEFGYQRRPDFKRFASLLKKANNGEKSAVKWVVKAIKSGNLNQSGVPESERFLHLKAWALKGDSVARQTLIEIIKQGQWLTELREPENRFAVLEELMKQGIPEATQVVARSLIDGDLCPLPKSERMQKLIDLSKEGYEEAQQALTGLMLPTYSSMSWFQDPLQPNDFGSTDDHITTLIRYGDEGNSHARQKLHRYLSDYFSMGRFGHAACSEGMAGKIVSVLFRWFAQGDLTCRLMIYNHAENLQGLKKKVLERQTLFNLFEIFIDPTQKRLNQLFRQVLSMVNRNDNGIYSF